MKISMTRFEFVHTLKNELKRLDGTRDKRGEERKLQITSFELQRSVVG
jgi:hypothetical protein